jgi:PAS domain S-box-containing protein
MPFGTFPDSGATFRTLLERMSAITYVRLPHDPKRGIHFSPSVEAVLGLTPDACATDPSVWTARLHPEDRARVLEEFERAHATLQPLSIEYRVGDAEGRIRWFRDEGEWVRNQAGQVAWLYGVLLEVTDRAHAEQGRRRLERLIATEHRIAHLLVETSSLREAGGHLLHALADLVNADVAGLWMPAGDALHPVALWSRDDTHFAPFVQASAQRTFTRGEGLPGRVWAAGVATVIANLSLDTNVPRVAVARCLGLTSAVALPVAVGDEFFGVMEFFGVRSLETDDDVLRSITAIGDAIAQSARRSAAEVDVARLNRAIERNARAQAQLIDDLLDISRIGSGQMRLDPSTFDLGTLLVSAADGLRPLADSRWIRLEVAVEQELPMIVGDPRRLKQVAINLLNNALTFTPAGGRVVLRAAREGSAVEFAVSDTGIGIAPEFLPYVFERFRRGESSNGGEPGGLGLGLAIARHLVELHGGAIAAESSGPGTGATFRVRLPTPATQ